MDQKKLGARIKEARLARQMTQSELVGEFITRNMLSQIESGSAVPSMKTLEYLCGKLDLPMSVLVTDEPGAELCRDIDLLALAKESLKSRDYESVIKLCQSFPLALWDEAQALSARAYFELSRSKMKNSDFHDAISCLEAAQAHSGEGIYASNTINAQSTLLIERCCRAISETAALTSETRPL